MKISDAAKAATMDAMTIALSNAPEKIDRNGEIGERIQRAIDAEVERLREGNKSHAKTIRAKLKEFKRVISEAWYERQLPNQWYGSGSSSARRAHGNYKGKSHIVWGEAATMAADECFAAIRALAAQEAGDEE